MESTKKLQNWKILNWRSLYLIRGFSDILAVASYSTSTIQMAAKQTRSDATTTLRRENIENKVAVTSSQKYADSFQISVSFKSEWKA